MASKASKPAESVQGVYIPPIEIKTYTLRIVGISPLICHAWSQKAKQEMLDKQMGRARNKKPPKDPERDYEEAFYRLEDGTPAFPTIAFKSAVVRAARQVELPMTLLRGTFHVVGDLVAIEGIPHMRQDTVRLQGKTTDLRYRPEFSEWAVNLIVQVNASVLTTEKLVHLFNQAGFSVGVGEWRPERDGRNGMFKVEAVLQHGKEE